MEGRNEFKLTDSLKNWKRSLSRNRSMTSDNIQELESHLLDEIDNLVSKDMSEEEAFLLATKQIGTKEFLASEFAKLDVFNKTIMRWMPFLEGVVCYFYFAMFISLTVKSSQFIDSYFNMDFAMVSFAIICASYVVFFISAAIYNNSNYGKVILSIYDNIPLLLLGFFTMVLMDVFMMEGVVLYDCFSPGPENTIYLSIYACILILVTAMIFYYKSRQVQKVKVAQR